MNRRSFLRFIGIGGAATLAPASLFAKTDVRGWRFGVWELQYRYGENYWARCDCGEEAVVSLKHLLSVDALSCDHAPHRGFFSINPEHLYCVCGEKRRFFSIEKALGFGGVGTAKRPISERTSVVNTAKLLRFNSPRT